MSTRQDRQTTPSNHQSTALALSNRNVIFLQAARQDLRPFDVVWNEFATECGVLSTYGPDKALGTLRLVLRDKYDNKEEFDKALFGALKVCLTEAGAVNKHSHDKEDCIVLELASSSELDGFEQYARGFARQVTRSMLQFPPEHGHQINSRHDHSCVLFKIGEEKPRLKRRSAMRIFPEVKHVTSTVELKTEATNCEKFVVNHNNLIMEPKLDRDHGALGQALIYNVADVIHCRARLGLSSKTEEIPVFVLAGRLSSPKTAGKKLQWVSAALKIPEKCGFELKYRVRNFSNFPSEESQPDTDEKEEAMQAVALSGYLDVLLFGLKGTKDVLANMEQKTLQSTVLCGHKLFFGSIQLSSCLYTASPIPGAEYPDKVEAKYTVSQGEIFVGDVNLRELREKTASDPRVIWINELCEEGNMNVVVKCSSQSFHRWLVTPSQARIALIMIRFTPTAARALSNVLQGVFFCGAGGMVVIMKNLAMHNYGALKANGAVAIDQLWNSFVKLVKSTFIPLAGLGIVHADIRPGYDNSANLLYRVIDGDMQLIDFESLVNADAFDSNDAYKFVWWQCLRVAFAWITQTSLSVMPVESVFRGDISLKKYEEDDAFKVAFGADWDDIRRLALEESLSLDELSVSLEQITKVVVKQRPPLNDLH